MKKRSHIPKIDKNFGHALRIKRNDLKKNQEQISKRAKIAASTLSYIETARTGCTISTAKQIADALKIPLWKLIKSAEEERL